MLNSAALHHPNLALSLCSGAANWRQLDATQPAFYCVGRGGNWAPSCKHTAQLAAELRSLSRQSLPCRGSTLISCSSWCKHASSTESPGPTIREPETVEQASQARPDWPARPEGCNPHVRCSAGQGFSPLIQPAHLC